MEKQKCIVYSRKEDVMLSCPDDWLSQRVRRTGRLLVHTAERRRLFRFAWAQMGSKTAGRRFRRD